MRHQLSFLFLFASTLLIGSCKKDKTTACPTIDITATITNSDGTNGAINASATGGSGFTYSKDGTTFVASGNFTGLAPASYTITAKNAEGCTGSKTFVVNATKTYYITRNTWKFSTATVGGVDVSAFLQTCQKDNVLTFAAAGTGTNDEGATKCNAGDPQTNPFTWSFQAGETQLLISSTLFTGGSGTFTIVTLSATQMVLSQPIVISGVTQTVTVTFIH